jgi:hypothetical protein
VPVPLANRINAYRRGVEHAPGYHESSEISALLAERQGIRDDLNAGTTLDSDAGVTLADADARLIACASVIAKHFPEFDALTVIRKVIGRSLLSTGPATRPDTAG